jgi:hypothetical protein
MAFHDEIKISNPNRTQEGHDERLNELVLAIRESLELPFPDDPSTFRVHLVGRKPEHLQRTRGEEASQTLR